MLDSGPLLHSEAVLRNEFFPLLVYHVLIVSKRLEKKTFAALLLSSQASAGFVIIIIIKILCIIITVIYLGCYKSTYWNVTIPPLYRQRRSY